ncbi:hypothetical protein ACH5RR_028923 [Cinchona calisaya]|uniref:Uncharacterized protein n=1 Tax=Cinchona calisaya TaxID=153742 RepID=A0ABD2YUM7_9GENT
MSLRHISRVYLRAVQALRDQNCKGSSIKPPNNTRPRSDSSTDNSNYVKMVSGSTVYMESVNKNASSSLDQQEEVSAHTFKPGLCSP